jgi:hypothetical protein
MSVALLMPREPVHGCVCFGQPSQRLLDFLSRGVSALDVPDHLLPQQREPCGAINVPVSRSFKVEGRGATFPKEGSIHASGIDLRQALSGFDHTPLREPYPAAEREIDSDAAAFIQHFVCAFEGKLGSVNALPGLGQFQGQNIGRYPATVGFPRVHHEVLTHGGAVRSLTPPRSSTIDIMVASAYEREYWRRWPEGRQEA